MATANEYLRERWLDLRNGASAMEMRSAQSAIDALLAVGVLTGLEAELWHMRIFKCPWHDDEGGRVWCAYCGDMKRQGGDRD